MLALLTRQLVNSYKMPSSEFVLALLTRQIINALKKNSPEFVLALLTRQLVKNTFSRIFLALLIVNC